MTVQGDERGLLCKLILIIVLLLHNWEQILQEESMKYNFLFNVTCFILSTDLIFCIRIIEIVYAQFPQMRKMVTHENFIFFDVWKILDYNMNYHYSESNDF